MDHSGDYSRAHLVGQANRISSWSDQGLDVYGYFNNDAAGHAIRNALLLKTLLT
jgi:uncharacterized protein YecE (DUF72 family)